MWQTVAAEIDITGNVKLLEKIRVDKPRRALLTILDEAEVVESEVAATPGNTAALLEFINSPFFANRPSYPMAEIEAEIEEARNSWE